jgi:hypothetical protein
MLEVFKQQCLAVHHVLTTIASTYSNPTDEEWQQIPDVVAIGKSIARLDIQFTKFRMAWIFLIFLEKAIFLDPRTKNSKHLENFEKECACKLLEKVYETEANKLQISTTLVVSTQVDNNRLPSKKTKY